MKYPIMQSNIKPLIDAQKYELMYEQSMSQPDEFWADQAQRIDWIKKFTKINQYKANLKQVVKAASKNILTEK